MLENKNVSEIINLIHSKQISVKEVVEFYIKRIEKYNPKLNAIVLLKETEKILEEAKKKIIKMININLCLDYHWPLKI